MLRFFFCVLLFAGWGLAALSLHVVRTDGGVAVVPKDSIGLADTWADVRGWSVDDLPAHQGLVVRLINTGKFEALAGVKGLPEGAADDLDILRSELRDFACREPVKVVKESKGKRGAKLVRLVDIAMQD